MFEIVEGVSAAVRHLPVHDFWHHLVNGSGIPETHDAPASLHDGSIQNHPAHENAFVDGAPASLEDVKDAVSGHPIPEPPHSWDPNNPSASIEYLQGLDASIMDDVAKIDQLIEKLKTLPNAKSLWYEIQMLSRMKAKLLEDHEFIKGLLTNGLKPGSENTDLNIAWVRAHNLMRQAAGIARSVGV